MSAVGRAASWSRRPDRRVWTTLEQVRPVEGQIDDLIAEINPGPPDRSGRW